MSRVKAPCYEEGSVTWEQMGRLVAWADRIRWSLPSIREDAEKVSILAREVFSPIAAGGIYGSGDILDERFGSPVNEEFYRRLRRELGFSDA